MTFTTDVVRTKTDAELQLFVDNPSHHHPDLIAAARRELHRREVPLIGPGSVSDEDSTSKRPLVLAAMVLGLGLVGAGFWWNARPPAPAPPKVNNLSAAALKLEAVETQQLPTFDTDALVADQLARIPAAEKQDAQALRQFRELGRRFWTAETQTEYLTNQADKGKASPLFADQAVLVRETWRAWNKAAVYGFRFGPKMQGQFDLMGQVASSQQHVLANLPALLPNRAFTTDKELVARGADVQDWLAGIRQVSPVTGRAYKATVLEIKL
ncbi:hypothetical protein GCM10027422_32490 [Hymenobacter arcticus]